MQGEIRRPRVQELAAIRQLVSAVVNETYGAIWPNTPIHVSDEDWSAGWVAVSDGALAGWMLSREDWLEDLWVTHPFQRQGIGSALLRHAEREIAARGVEVAHLYVISSNERAIAFYRRHGWERLRELPHELLSIPRLEMIKTVSG